MSKIVSKALALLLAAGILLSGGNVYAAEPDGVTENAIQTDPATGEIRGDGWMLNEAGVFTMLQDVPDVQEQPYEWEQYAEQIKEVTAAEGVTEIPDGAFSGKYENLEKATMPSTVKRIGTSAFSGDANLTEVILNDGLEYVGHSAFAATGITSIRLPDGVTWGGDAFTNCKNLTGTLVIPANSKWEQGSNAQFYGIGATAVVIEEGITEITNQFLNGCTNLQYVWAPKSLVNIGQPDPAISKWDSPIPACCIIGYKGTMAEKYVEHWLGIGSDWTEGMTFHAIDGEEHTFGEWQTVQNATCTDKGVRKHTCTICNAERMQEVEPLGHKWDSGKVTQAATEKEEGIKTYTCTVCGVTMTEAIPRLAPTGNGAADKSDGEVQKISARSNTNPPRTGDSADLPGWGVLMTASAAIAGFYVRKRAAR